MKKILIFIVGVTLALTFQFGCQQKNILIDKVSELRSDVFFGQSESFTVKAGYGFKESPYDSDGKVKTKIYALTFKLLNTIEDNATYTLFFTFNNVKHQAEFKLNPVTHSLTATIEIEQFSLKTFDVDVVCGSTAQTVNMRSILPDKTIDHLTALDFLYKNQTDLIKSYVDANGNFNAEIYLRVLVKDDKPYWYVGLATNNGNLKALLIDGYNGEVLAVREIF